MTLGISIERHIFMLNVIVLSVVAPKQGLIFVKLGATPCYLHAILPTY
jgi:hypothetical protein